MKKMQQGFTLIELMIVIAIIGILAAIAIPQYNDYVTRSQLTASLSEISGGRTAYEEMLQRGAIDTNTTPGDVGLQTPTSRCDPIEINDYSSATGTPGDAEINCTMQGNTDIEGVIIGLNRDDNANWNCEVGSTAIEDSLLPDGCSTF